MSLNWANVRSLAIPVGGVSRDVKRVTIGGAVVWEKNALPYGAEVEYLESTGTQWIATTTIDDPANNIAQVTFSITSSTSASMFIFGSSPTRFNFVAARWGSGRYNFGSTGVTTPVLPISVGDVHTGTYTLDNDQLAYTLDGASAVYGSSMVFDNLPFGLFTIYNSTVNKFIGRIYNFKVTRKSDGAVLADYIPVRKSGVGYLYDRVTGQLFGNAGTGDFVIGPDVVPVEYIESHGTEYIDTGVVPRENMRFALSFSNYTHSGVDAWFFGGRTAYQSNALGVYYSKSQGRIFGAVGNVQSFTALSASSIEGGAHTIEIDSAAAGGIRLDGTEVLAINNGTFSNPSIPVTLLTINLNGTVADAKVRLRASRFQVLDGSTPVRDYVPLRVGSGSSWEGAMMDTLTRRIYRNAGTGAFTYGGDLPLGTLAN